jgi:hypothetical protein
MNKQTLSTEAWEIKREYYRKWRKKSGNSEKQKEYQKKYWNRLAAERRLSESECVECFPEFFKEEQEKQQENAS